RVGVDRVEASIAPAARALEAAERCRRVAHIERVDPDGAGPELARDSMGTPDVARPDRRGEPERAVVRDPDRVVRVGRVDHCEHGPEYLLARDPHPVVDAGEDRWRHEVAARILAHPVPTGYQARARRTADVDVAEHLLGLAGVDD